ncbi:MAG: hypothetical protein U0670_06460 [Anaerolineae bacterium]
MKKLRFTLWLIISLTALSVGGLGSSVMAQAEENLLLFQHYDSAQQNLYVLDAQTNETRFITEMSSNGDAGWSPDGRVWVVENVEERDWRLRFFDVRTGQESSFEQPIYSSGCYAGVYWSPNGEQFAYISQSEDTFYLNVENLADGSRYQIEADPNAMPFWSPDNRYLSVKVVYSALPSMLYRAEDGSILSGPQRFWDYSPDSRFIFYQDEQGGIYLYELATGENLRMADADYGVWSATGRYFMPMTFTSSDSLRTYDTQTQRFQTIDLGFPVVFAKWAVDERGVFLYADYPENSLFPRKLVYYDLESQTATTLLEGVGRAASIYQSGDWAAITYNTTAPQDPRESTDRLLFYDGTQRLDVAFAVQRATYWPNIYALEGAAAFLIYGDEGIRYFDRSSGSLEVIYSGTHHEFPTANARYLAFLGSDGQQALNRLNIWDSESHATIQIEQEASWIIGWQNSPQRNSLLYCGEG